MKVTLSNGDQVDAELQTSRSSLCSHGNEVLPVTERTYQELRSVVSCHFHFLMLLARAREEYLFDTCHLESLRVGGCICV